MPIIFQPTRAALPSRGLPWPPGTVLQTPTARLGSLNLNQVDEHGCEIWFSTIEGWDSPASSVEITQRVGEHGGYATAGFLTPREITITGAVVAPDKQMLRDAKDRVNAASSLSEVTLMINEFSMSRFVTVVRTGGVTWEDTPAPYAKFTMSLVATDPRKYGAEEQSVMLRVPRSEGGRSYPDNCPFSFTAYVNQDSATIINKGNIDAPVRIDMYGDVSGPWVEQLESGRRLDFDLSYDAGRYTALDSKRRSVLLDGLASRAYTMSGRWFNLPPGPSTIRYGGTSTQGQARAFVRWRDTYL